MKWTEEQKAAEKPLEPFVERVKTLLGDRVKEVRLTHRLTDTPAIVATDADEMSTQMAKLFAAAGQQAPEVKYIFELNPDHPLVKRAAEPWAITPISPSGLTCCWIRRCWPNAARWKIRTCSSVV